jgi:hypothetical protein
MQQPFAETGFQFFNLGFREEEDKEMEDEVKLHTLITVNKVGHDCFFFFSRRQLAVHHRHCPWWSGNLQITRTINHTAKRYFLFSPLRKMFDCEVATYGRLMSRQNMLSCFIHHGSSVHCFNLKIFTSHLIIFRFLF